MLKQQGILKLLARATLSSGLLGGPLLPAVLLVSGMPPSHAQAFLGHFGGSLLRKKALVRLFPYIPHFCLAPSTHQIERKQNRAPKVGNKELLSPPIPTYFTFRSIRIRNSTHNILKVCQSLICFSDRLIFLNLWVYLPNMLVSKSHTCRLPPLATHRLLPRLFLKKLPPSLQVGLGFMPCI